MSRAASAVLCLAAGATTAAVTIAASAAGSTAVGVGLREYRITPYRTSVPRGEVRFNIHNYGEDRHNFVVRGPGRFRAETPDIRSGANYSLTVNLARVGTYRLLCTTADHERRGMRSRIRVVRS